MTPFSKLFKLSVDEVYAHNGYVCPFMIKSMVVERGVHEIDNAVVRDFIASLGFLQRNRYAWTKGTKSRVPPPEELSKICKHFPQLDTPYKAFLRDPDASVEAIHRQFPKYTEETIKQIRDGAREFRDINELLNHHNPKKRASILRSGATAEDFMTLSPIFRDLRNTKSAFSREEISELMHLPLWFVSAAVDPWIDADRIRVVQPKLSEYEREILVFM